MSAQTPVSRIPKGRRPQYFADPATDKLLSMVMTLASELSVTRARLDAVERLLDGAGILSREQVERFTPDPTAAADRENQRQRMIDRLLAWVDAERQENESDFPRNRQALLDELERDP